MGLTNALEVLGWLVCFLLPDLYWEWVQVSEVLNAIADSWFDSRGDSRCRSYREVSIVFRVFDLVTKTSVVGVGERSDKAEKS